MKRLELACFSLQDALKGAELGVHRIEFCKDYTSGGTTPDYEDFRVLREKHPILPIHVMIRPRPGDFVHTPVEINLMAEQIMRFEQLGANGFVFGVLDEVNQINRSACLKLIAVAKGKPCVFHRAFDLLPNANEALEELIRLGFRGVLTSGCSSNALEGISTLESLHAEAKGRIEIVAGGGIRANNMKTLLETDLTWFHSAAWVKESKLMDEEEIETMLEFMNKNYERT